MGLGGYIGKLFLSTSPVLLAIMSAVLSFCAPLRAFLFLALGLVVSDLITGTIAARKRGEPIHSRGLGRTVQKFLVYFLALLAAEGMRVVFMPAVSVAYFVALAICATEFQSVVENVESITGVNIWRRVKGLFNNKNQIPFK